LLTLEVLLGELAAWLDKRQEFRLLMLLLTSQVYFELAPLFLLNLLHGLEEELLDIAALVEDHLADRF